MLRQTNSSKVANEIKMDRCKDFNILIIRSSPCGHLEGKLRIAATVQLVQQTSILLIPSFTQDLGWFIVVVFFFYYSNIG